MKMPMPMNRVYGGDRYSFLSSLRVVAALCAILLGAEES